MGSEYFDRFCRQRSVARSRLCVHHMGIASRHHHDFRAIIVWEETQIHQGLVFPSKSDSNSHHVQHRIIDLDIF